MNFRVQTNFRDYLILIRVFNLSQAILSFYPDLI